MLLIGKLKIIANNFYLINKKMKVRIMKGPSIDVLLPFHKADKPF
jgi:hypothetical protein